MITENDKSVVSKEIRKNIEDILQIKFHFSKGIVFVEGQDYPFFGLRGLLNPRELTYLTYLLEMQYNIRFSAEEYDDPIFYSLDGLSKIVARLVKYNV